MVHTILSLRYNKMYLNALIIHYELARLHDTFQASVCLFSITDHFVRKTHFTRNTTLSRPTEICHDIHEHQDIPEETASLSPDFPLLKNVCTVGAVVPTRLIDNSNPSRRGTDDLSYLYKETKYYYIVLSVNDFWEASINGQV